MQIELNHLSVCNIWVFYFDAIYTWMIISITAFFLQSASLVIVLPTLNTF